MSILRSNTVTITAGKDESILHVERKDGKPVRIWIEVVPVMSLDAEAGK
jgi:hypothetical protein